jgi:hypothetical protein
MGPKGFWIALAIVMFYLITRPHVGTVWYIAVPPPQPLPSGAVPIASSQGFVPDAPPTTAFTEKKDCWFALTPFRGLGAECVPKNALLWGW